MSLVTTDNSPPPAAPVAPARFWRWLPIAAGVAYLALAGHAAYVETPTVDEFAHLPAGCAYWKYGRLDLYCKNPPLLRYWMAVPVVLDRRAEVPPITDPPWDWGPWQYGVRFMDANRANYFAFFFHARLMIVVLGLATAWLLYRWARAVFDMSTASIVTSLFLLSPNVLAHAHLATTDVGCMFGVLLTLFSVRWAYQRPRVWRFAVTGAALGVALLIKFTAWLLVPLVLGLVVLHRLRGPARPEGRWGRVMLRDGVVTLAVAAFFVNLGLGFKGSFQPLGSYGFSSSFCQTVRAALPGWLPVPLPEDYVVGFDGQKMDAESGEFGSYLLGEWSTAGLWAYNFVALGVKLPLVLLLLLAAGTVCWFRLPLSAGARWTVPLAAVVFAVALSLLSRLNLGMRYLLPALPFLYLLTGAFWHRLATVRGPIFRVAASVVLGCYVFVIAAIHPAYLGYFNALAGGPDGGHRVLADSNLDWGQDLYRLPAALADLHADQPVRLLYFGHVSPVLYGIRAVPLADQPTPDVIAVSMNYVLGAPYVVITHDGRVLHVPRDYARWLRDRQPVRRLGSMLVYDLRK